MATLALEVNDAGLLALRAGSTGLRRREGGPGFALFEGARLLVGEDARARSRLLPRLTTSRSHACTMLPTPWMPTVLPRSAFAR